MQWWTSAAYIVRFQLILDKQTFTLPLTLTFVNFHAIWVVQIVTMNSQVWHCVDSTLDNYRQIYWNIQVFLAHYVCLYFSLLCIMCYVYFRTVYKYVICNSCEKSIRNISTECLSQHVSYICILYSVGGDMLRNCKS